MAIRIGVVGLGKIAHDQHLPTIAASPDFALAATASPGARLEGVPGYDSIEAMLSGPEPLEAVALCQPPQFRFQAAREALEAGKHVFLEKPPGATVGAVRALAEIADRKGLTLFASWHSRCAAGVEPARRWLSERRIRSVQVEWKEDVRHWHPGQAWIWTPGGLGVFDPGINALSIVTAMLPQAIFVTRAKLSFPANRAAPIAAEIGFSDASGLPITAAFDWRQTGPQTWDVRVETDAGKLVLSKGGSELTLDGVPHELPAEAEYRGLYDQFAALVRDGRSDVDWTPLALTADAFLVGERVSVAAFED